VTSGCASNSSTRGKGKTPKIRVWWDGREHPALHYSKNNLGDKGQLWRIPEYEWLESGLEHYQDYSGLRSRMDAWLDESWSMTRGLAACAK
jgi:hypothetical protein